MPAGRTSWCKEEAKKSGCQGTSIRGTILTTSSVLVEYFVGGTFIIKKNGVHKGGTCRVQLRNKYKGLSPWAPFSTAMMRSARVLIYH